jgi:hypothetical protein
MRNKKIKKCAEWLASCLEIGWSKNDLDGLQELWMANHDDNGNYKAQFQQHSIGGPASASVSEGEQLGNEVSAKSVCDGCKDIAGFYLGTTCPKCNRPFRSVK